MPFAVCLVAVLVLVWWVPTPGEAQPVPAGPQFEISSGGAGQNDFGIFERNPSVAVAPNGDFMVVWDSEFQDGAADGVFGRLYDSEGNLQGGEFQVNTYTTQSQVGAQVATDGHGNFVVVWQSNGQDSSSSRDWGSWGIFGQRYDNTGNAQGGEFQVNTYSTYSQQNPQVAADAHGNFVVVWNSESQDGSDWGVFGQRYDNTGNAQGGEFQINVNTSDQQGLLAVAMGANSDLVILYVDYDYPRRLFAQLYDSAGTLKGDPVQLNLVFSYSNAGRRVAVAANGHFVLVGTDSNKFTVIGQWFDTTGTPLGAEFQVDEYVPTFVALPEIAISPGEEFVVVWERYTERWGPTKESDVFARFYDSAGVPVGGEFQVNTYTTDDQQDPAVAIAANGDFVVAWEGDRHAGGRKVDGRRFTVDAASVCTDPEVIDGTPCHDSDACSQTDTCQAGVCVGEDPLTCTALDQCHDAGVCEPATGQCSDPAKPDGVQCNDGSACTQRDVCVGGTCEGYDPVVCVVTDPCKAGSCHPETGQCSAEAKPDGHACDDGNPCTTTARCEGGACVAGEPVICTALGRCHLAGICDPETGLCSNPQVEDGTGCDDADACTGSDTCQAGVCVGEDLLTCTALDQCHDAGVCEPATGQCSDPPAIDGTLCDDGDPATVLDQCHQGLCLGTFTQLLEDPCDEPLPPRLKKIIGKRMKGAEKFLQKAKNAAAKAREKAANGKDKAAKRLDAKVEKFRSKAKKQLEAIPKKTEKAVNASKASKQIFMPCKAVIDGIMQDRSEAISGFVFAE
jgi:hypothetical protein